MPKPKNRSFLAQKPKNRIKTAKPKIPMPPPKMASLVNQALAPWSSAMNSYLILERKTYRHRGNCFFTPVLIPKRWTAGHGRETPSKMFYIMFTTMLFRRENTQSFPNANLLRDKSLILFPRHCLSLIEAQRPRPALQTTMNSCS